MPELKPLCDNQSVGDMVTVDLDVFFDDFSKEIEEVPEGEDPGFTRHAVINRLMIIENAINQEVKSVIYRRSSNGHVHVRIFFDHEITVLDAFMIRAGLWDDRTRLALDEARYLLTKSLHEMNRCFDEKADGDGTKHAGPWISLHACKSSWSREIRSDFESFDWIALHKKYERERKLKVKIKWIDCNDELGWLLKGYIGEIQVFAITTIPTEHKVPFSRGRYMLDSRLPECLPDQCFSECIDNLKETATHELISWLAKSGLIDKHIDDDQWKQPAKKDEKKEAGSQSELGFC